jgi:hypothetical protein
MFRPLYKALRKYFLLYFVITTRSKMQVLEEEYECEVVKVQNAQVFYLFLYIS